jgi:hypothetical protein
MPNGGAEQALRARRRLVIGVLGEVEPVDHALENAGRHDHRRLAGDGVGGRPEGRHDLVAEHLLLAAVDHQRGAGRVLRPDQHEQRQRQDHAEHRAEPQHVQVTAEHEIDAAQIDARLRKLLFHC